MSQIDGIVQSAAALYEQFGTLERDRQVSQVLGLKARFDEMVRTQMPPEPGRLVSKEAQSAWKRFIVAIAPLVRAIPELREPIPPKQLAQFMEVNRRLRGHE